MLDISGELTRHINNFRGEHLTKLGSGLHRTAYRINSNKFGQRYKGKVVKYAKKPKGVKYNRKEFSTWMNVKGTPLAQDFSPIRDRSQNFEFLIMDYARPASTITRADITDMKDRLTETYELEDAVHDLYDANMGYHDKRGLVVIDYPWGGNFQHQSRE